MIPGALGMTIAVGPTGAWLPGRTVVPETRHQVRTPTTDGVQFMTITEPTQRSHPAAVPQLQIHAVHVGTLMGLPAPALTYQRGYGETYDPAMIMFVIVGGEHPVVVDTGTPDPEFVKKHHNYELIRPAEQEPLAALARIGVDPADVGTVIHTHLHWDHCSNDHLFPHARISVQKAELHYAVDPVEPNWVAYERLPGLKPPWVDVLDRIDTVTGHAQILPGISVVPLPGHTPGSQGVLVEAAERRFLLAGDCVNLYVNWDGDDRARHLPNGSLTNLLDNMDSFRRMERLDCEIVPSHDPRVVERGVFA